MKKIIQPLLLVLIFSATMSAQNVKNVEITELNSATFKEKVWNFEKSTTFKRVGKLPIILDFYATWCRPCKMLSPHLQTIQNNYSGKLIVYKIDVDKEPELAKRFNIRAMPTIIFIGSKTEYNSEVGYREYQDVEDLVKKYFLF
jgi:thioredoxin 1